MAQTLNRAFDKSIIKIERMQADGYAFHVKDDGYPYLRLMAKILDGDADSKPLLIEDENNCVFRVEDEGRTFVYKRISYEKRRLDSRLQRLLFGSFYVHLMRATHAALAKGCAVIPDMYVVAEKAAGGLPVDTRLLIEYIPGESLVDADAAGVHRGGIADAFAELHRHGLALGNVKTANMIYDPARDRVRVIDLSNRNPQIIGRAQDAVRLKKRFGIDIPPQFLLDYAIRPLLTAHYLYRRLRRRIREG